MDIFATAYMKESHHTALEKSERLRKENTSKTVIDRAVQEIPNSVYT